jgi:phosphoglycolate phosphatase-like HAD superfamily hydrolase
MPNAEPDWLRVLQSEVLPRLGRVRHALFDFDGTLSVLRQGWEEVMAPVMVEAICGGEQPLPSVEQEVQEFIDRSSGILTIRQMQWLVEAVRRHGRSASVLTAEQYKAIYLERLMVRVRQRIECLQAGQSPAADFCIAGAGELLDLLARRGVRLYLASGTDHDDVVREAAVLGLLPYFEERVYGAVENEAQNAKERVIQRILDENHLSGEALLVVGDGPVEIREGVRRGAVTLGVAADEVARRGWNPRKVDRLTQAGAVLLVADFCRAADLAALLCDYRAVEGKGS